MPNQNLKSPSPANSMNNKHATQSGIPKKNIIIVVLLFSIPTVFLATIMASLAIGTFILSTLADAGIGQAAIEPGFPISEATELMMVVSGSLAVICVLALILAIPLSVILLRKKVS